MARKPKRYNPNYRIKQLEKENRILKRQIGELKKELKVDIKAERQKCYKEGYETCREQMILLLNTYKKEG